MSNRFKYLPAFGALSLLAVVAWSGFSALSPESGYSSRPKAADAGADLALASQSAGSPSAPGADEPRPPLQAELKSLRDQLRAQRGENARQAREIERLSDLLADGGYQDDSVCDDEFDDELVSVEISQREKALAAERSAVLDRALAAENFDHEGSNALQARVAELLRSQHFEGSLLAQAECGQTLCRVELQHQGEDAERTFVDFSPLLLERNAEGFIEIIEYEDGGKGALIYLSRDGFGLPESPG